MGEGGVDDTGSRDAIERRQEALNTLKRSVVELERTIASLESQIGTDIHSQLSAQEHAQLSVLTEGMAQLREALLISSTERMKVGPSFLLKKIKQED